MKRPIDKGLNKMVNSERLALRPTVMVKHMINSEITVEKDKEND